MSTAARVALISFATSSGGSYTTIGDIMSGSVSMDKEMIDVTVLAAEWRAKLDGLKNASYELDGFYKASDTGQAMLWTQLLGTSELWIKFLFDGVNGYKQQVRVTKINPSGDVAGAMGFKVSMESTGAPTAVP